MVTHTAPRKIAAPGFCRDRPWLYPGKALGQAVLLGAGAPAEQAPLLLAAGAGLRKATVRLGDDVVALDDALLLTDAAALASRHPVASYGSNCDPLVLARKFAGAGVSPVVPLVPGRLANAALAASAHVSRPGYIPAGIVRRPGAELPVVVAWLDDEQLRCLDATEGNYERRSLDAAEHPVTLDCGETVRNATVYVTAWGVIPLSARETSSQVAVWRAALRRSASLQTLVAAAPDASDRALHAVMVRLARDDALREAARDCLRATAEDCGFGPIAHRATAGVVAR